jgi:hypothetical protein
LGGSIPAAEAGHSIVPIEQEQSCTVMFFRMWSAVQNFDVSTFDVLQGASFLSTSMQKKIRVEKQKYKQFNFEHEIQKLFSKTIELDPKLGPNKPQ